MLAMLTAQFVGSPGELTASSKCDRLLVVTERGSSQHLLWLKLHMPLQLERYLHNGQHAELEPGMLVD